MDKEIASLLDRLAADHGTDVTWRRVQEYAAASIPKGAHLASLLKHHVDAELGTTSDPWGIEAATDMRNLVNDAGMEAVTWGPGHLEQAHTVDECIDLHDAAIGLEILIQTTKDLLG